MVLTVEHEKSVVGCFFGQSLNRVLPSRRLKHDDESILKLKEGSSLLERGVAKH